MRVLALIPMLALLAIAGPALAGSHEHGVGETADEAMERTDRNRDGYVDRGEFHSRMVDVYYLADADKDGLLEAEEYADTEISTFEQCDLNADGKVEMYEFIKETSDRYEAADTNKDGRVSEREVMETYAQEE